MKKVYRVKGSELKEIDYFANMDINDGDVYGFDDPDAGVIWIWIGSKSSVEESTVSAWFINKIEQERDGKPEVMTINQGEEPMIFKENWSLNVVKGDTPEFLEQPELDKVQYKLYRVFVDDDTQAIDNAKIGEIEISKDSLDSKDVFVLDAQEAVYYWIGRAADVEEKRITQVTQRLDADRNYLPIQYTIYEGKHDTTEQMFYDLLKEIEKMDSEDNEDISVGDSLEQQHNQGQDEKISPHPDMPAKGTVAARLAAIDSRNNDNKDEDKISASTKMHSPGKREPKSKSKQTAQSSSTKPPAANPKSEPKREKISRSRSTSRSFGGAPAPTLGPLKSGKPEEYRPKETDDEKETDIDETTDTADQITQESEAFEPEIKSKEEVPPPSETTIPSDELPDEPEEVIQPDTEQLETPRPSSTSTPEPEPEAKDESLPELKGEIEKDEPQSKPIEKTSPDKSDRRTKPGIVKDCPNLASHADVWKDDETCPECGMSGNECPASNQHLLVWQQGNECVVCKAQD